jgi:hypothetical protein
MASVEGGEGCVGISVVLLAVGSEKNCSNALQSPHLLQIHVQVEEIGLILTPSCRHIGISSVMLRLVAIAPLV